MIERDIIVNGKRTHFAKAGKGPPIVLVHGWTNNWKGWVPLINYAVEDFTIYAIDQMGYGKSDRLSEYSVKLQADYLARFIRKVDIKPVAVCGLSMATFVVSDFALRFSELTKSIILIGPVFPVDRRRKVVGKLIRKGLEIINNHELSESALKKIIEQRITGYISAKYLTMYKFNKFLIDAYSLIGRKEMSKEVFIQMGISAYEYPLAETIDSLDIPTLLIFGSDDKFTNLRQAKKVLARKDIKFAEVEHAGHVASLEQPNVVAQEIKKFLSSTIGNA